MVASIDPAEGAKIAKVCMACHNFEPGGPNGIGPHLNDVLNRKKDSVAGFDYSGALEAQGGDVWTYAELNKFLWKPKKYAPGTKMNFIGLKKPEDRAAILICTRSKAVRCRQMQKSQLNRPNSRLLKKHLLLTLKPLQPMLPPRPRQVRFNPWAFL